VKLPFGPDAADRSVLRAAADIGTGYWFEWRSDQLAAPLKIDRIPEMPARDPGRAYRRLAARRLCHLATDCWIVVLSNSLTDPF
jgi:hypothetical protein